MTEELEEAEKRQRRQVPPWMKRAGKPVSNFAKRLRDRAMLMAKDLASSPAALALLAGALGIGAIAYAEDRWNDDPVRAAQIDYASDIEALRARVADLDGAALAADASVADLSTELESITEAVQSGDAQIAERAAARANVLATGLSAEAERINNVTEDVSALSDAVADLPVDADVQANAEAIAEVAQASSEVAERLSGTAADLADLTDAVGVLAEDLAETDAEVGTIGIDLDAAEESIARTREELTDTDTRLSETQAGLAEAVERIAAAEQALAQVASQAASALERIGTAEGDIDGIQQDLENLRPLIQQARDAATAAQAAADAAQSSADEVRVMAAEALARVGVVEYEAIKVSLQGKPRTTVITLAQGERAVLDITATFPTPFPANERFVRVFKGSTLVLSQSHGAQGTVIRVQQYLVPGLDAGNVDVAVTCETACSTSSVVVQVQRIAP